MERRFDEELQVLKERLLVMGSLAEAMIQISVQALVDRDEALIQRVYDHEEVMDQLAIEIDDRCFKLLALRQPMASDLRFIAAGIKLNSELERIGDLAVNIAHRSSSLLKQPFPKPLIDIPRMARLCQEMVKRSLDAFVTRDPELARLVIEADDEIDILRDQMVQELLRSMVADPATIPHALDLLLVARNLERVADHATNIAEDVIYIVRGEDVRERGDKEIRKGIRRREGERVSFDVAERDTLTRAMREAEEFLSLLKAAARNLLDAAKALQEMMDHYEDPEEKWQRIRDFEAEGDRLTHHIMQKLHRTFLTIIDRKDLHALTSALDDVVDGIEAAASRMVLYRLEQPPPKASVLAGLVVAAAEQVVTAVFHLPTFQAVEEPCIEINRLENAADEVYREAITGLFEGAPLPLDTIKWKEIYEILEAITDRCEDVANVVEAITLKHT